MRTRNQEYAALIFQQVSEIEEAAKKKYGSMAHKLPVLIRTAGLAQALEFVNTRSEEPQRRLLKHLAQVINGSMPEALLARSRTEPLSEYMHLTHQVLTALLWYKRFAQSILRVEVNDEAEGV